MQYRFCVQGRTRKSRRAIDGERARQIELLEEGRKVIQETRRWDDNKEYSYAMRSKEDAKDYRYFPDPDLPPIHISDEWIAKIRSEMPEFREEKAARHLSKNQLEVARDRLQMAAFLQYTLPGSPSLYYGDEALMEGYKDPFNRRTYPWGREDTELVRFFRQLGQLRRDIPALGKGTITFQTAMDKHLAYTRCYEGQKFTVYVNRSGDPWQVPAGKVSVN